MCTTNHGGFAKPGYLIDARAESVAPTGALYTRPLSHHAEVGLSDDQIRALLDLNREYHDRQNAIRIEMSILAEQVEIKEGRVDAAALDLRREALGRRAALFAEDEMLFFEMAVRGHEVLTAEQVATAESIYHAEKDDGIRALADSLDSALAPSFFLGKV